MCNKRLLLLGFTIVVLSGWMYPTTAGSRSDEFSPPRPVTDTERLAGAKQGGLSKSNPELIFSSELFLATEVGGANGARLNPKALGFIEDYVKENWEELQLVRTTGGAHFNLIENILAQYDLPKELKYLAVIESDLKPSAVSRVGAVGPWQLMPQTARDLGLKVNKRVDERRNYVKSTRAAALYLKDLYSQLGDWLLVIAAYNTGTAKVFQAIRKSGTRDFWELQDYLPLESRIHVKKFIATQYVFEGQGGVTTLTRKEAMEELSGSDMYVFHRDLTPAELNDSRTITVSGKYAAGVIARYVLMDSTEFNRYNPDFDKVMASANNSYDLKLPADKMDLFEANKYEILTQSMQQLNSGSDVAQLAVK